MPSNVLLFFLLSFFWVVFLLMQITCIREAAGVLWGSPSGIRKFTFFLFLFASFFVLVVTPFLPPSGTLSGLIFPFFYLKTDTFVTSYFEFEGNFTSNLKDSRKFLQLGVGISTQYDETVIENVELHQLALRSEVLGTVSDFTEEDVKGKIGRDALAARIVEAINAKLEQLEGFGGIDSVHFTSFVLQ